MQPTAFRRVFKSLSPRKHSDSKSPQVSSPTNISRSPPDSPATRSPSPSRPASPTAAVEDHYARFLSRLSFRADHVAPATPATPVAPSPSPPRSPPPLSPGAARAASRMHRRAMRDVTLPRQAAANAGDAPLQTGAGLPADDTAVVPAVENARPALPPMYVGVDPVAQFRDFVPVGNGASGVVFFARRGGKGGDRGERVALKKVTPSTRAKSKALENEIRTMHVLRHPNIVQCHEAYSFDGSVWIVMEAMDVGCLTHVLDFLRAKAYLLSESHIAYILRETLLGLWTMHSHSRMHRDIKSDNILVSSQGEIKLADFEYTAVLTEDTPKRNTIVGTAWWMAPETVRSSYYDYGADVWSIGILSVECAEWVPPLFGMESAKAMEVIRAGQKIQGFKRPDMWSPEFADFVRGCLTRDRDLRYSVPDLLRHPFLAKACTKTQIANVFRAVRGMQPIVAEEQC